VVRTRQQLLLGLASSMLHQFPCAHASLQLLRQPAGVTHHSLPSIARVVSEHSQVGCVLLKLCSSSKQNAPTQTAVEQRMEAPEQTGLPIEL
jgi:hypothetical protein